MRPRYLKSSSARHDFSELSSNNGLTGSVEGQRQFVNHLPGVLARGVHGSHTRTLLTASTLLHTVVDESGEGEFVGLGDGLRGEHGQAGGLVRDHRLESVVENFAGTKLVARVDDGRGDGSSILVGWGSATNLVAAQQHVGQEQFRKLGTGLISNTDDGNILRVFSSQHFSLDGLAHSGVCTTAQTSV